MKWRVYGNEILTSNRTGKVVVLFFQLLFCWQYCNIEGFTLQHNIFTTYPLVGPGGITGNLAWLLYYLGGEFYLLPTLQDKLLAANPLVVVRNEKRTTILQNCLLTTIAFAIVYNLLFLGVITAFAGGGNMTWAASLHLLCSLCLSLAAFTTFLLLCSLLEPVLGELAGIALVLIALALKTRCLPLLTTQLCWGADLISCGWLLATGLGLSWLNKGIETK